MTPEQLKAQQAILVLAFAAVGLFAGRQLAAPPDGSWLTPLGLAGAGLGLAVGAILRLDHVRLLARLENTPPTAAPRFGWPAVVMLVVPAVAVGVFWLNWLTPVGVPMAVGSALTAAAVPATMLLAYFDSRRLLLAAPRPLPPGSPGLPAGNAGLLGVIWPLGYPLHFVARRRVGGSGWFIAPGLLVTLAAMSPLLARWTGTLPIPAPDSQVVRAELADRLGRGDALAGIEEPSVSPNRDAAGGVAVFRRSRGGEGRLRFYVHWRDRSAGLWEIGFDTLPGNP